MLGHCLNTWSFRTSVVLFFLAFVFCALIKMTWHTLWILFPWFLTATSLPNLHWNSISQYPSLQQRSKEGPLHSPTPPQSCAQESRAVLLALISPSQSGGNSLWGRRRWWGWCVTVSEMLKESLLSLLLFVYTLLVSVMSQKHAEELGREPRNKRLFFLL